jgi:hypothetical protein
MPFNGADPTDTLFQCLLGMAVGVIKGLRRLAEIMAVAQLVWHIGEHLRDGTADGQLAVRHDTNKRYLQVLLHGPEQYGEVWLGRRQQTAGQEDFPGEAIPQDPQPLMADIRLETIQRQEDPAPSLGDPLQARAVGEREGEQFVIAFEEMRDGPWGDRHPTGAHRLMDFRQAAVLGVVQRANPDNDIEAKLVLGQGEPSLFFRSGRDGETGDRPY